MLSLLCKHSGLLGQHRPILILVYCSCIISYLTIPLWLLREAKIRKHKTGHAIPLQAMEDAEHSQVSAAAMARIHEINALEESSAVKIADLDGVEKDEKHAHHTETPRELV